MESTVHMIDQVYSRQQAVAAIAMARRWSVEAGGLYEATTASISIWTCAHLTPAMREESELVGTIHVAWNHPDPGLATVTGIEVQPGWSLGDAARHLDHLFGALALPKAA